MHAAQSQSLPDLRDHDQEFRKSGFFALKRSSKVRDINLEEIKQRRASIYHGAKKKLEQMEKEEQERWERRRRGLYGLSNSEKACFARPVPAAPDTLARMKDMGGVGGTRPERRSVSKGTVGTVRSESACSDDGQQSPKPRRRNAALVTERAALSSVELTEDPHKRLLRAILNPSTQTPASAVIPLLRGNRCERASYVAP